MKIRIIFARTAGSLYVLLGLINLLGLLIPDVRDQIINFGAVIFRYGGFVVIGAGLLFLRKWSAYLWGTLMVANLILVYTIYGSQTSNPEGGSSLLSLVGPILIVVFFYYVWPVLSPEKPLTEKDHAH